MNAEAKFQELVKHETLTRINIAVGKRRRPIAGVSANVYFSHAVVF